MVECTRALFVNITLFLEEFTDESWLKARKEIKTDGIKMNNFVFIIRIF